MRDLGISWQLAGARPARVGAFAGGFERESRQSVVERSVFFVDVRSSSAVEDPQVGNAPELVLGPAVSQPGAAMAASAARRSLKQRSHLHNLKLA